LWHDADGDRRQNVSATLTHVKHYGDCIGPLGFQMPSALAKAIERLLKSQSSDARSVFRCDVNGESVEGYCRAFKAPGTIETNDEERSDTSLVTTASLDRDFEVLDPKGADWAQFRKNPIVTFAHEYRALPVGKAAWVKRQASKDPNQDGWLAKTLYAGKPDGWTGEWMADAVWHLVKTGVIKGKSIGFIPLRYREIEEGDIKRRPELASATWMIEKYVVLEYAVAPVQSNPDALVEEIGKMKTKGLILPDDILESIGIIVPEPGRRSVKSSSQPDPDDGPALPGDMDLSDVQTVDEWRAERRRKRLQALKGFDARRVAGETLAKMRGAV